MGESVKTGRRDILKLAGGVVGGLIIGFQNIEVVIFINGKIVG